MSFKKKFFDPIIFSIGLIKREKGLKKLFLISTIIFALIYMSVVGMISYGNMVLPFDPGLFYFDVSFGTPIGTFPWFTLILFRKILLSINLNSILFVAGLSSFFSLNITLTYYIRTRLPDCCNYAKTSRLFSSLFHLSWRCSAVVVVDYCSQFCLQQA